MWLWWAGIGRATEGDLGQLALSSARDLVEEVGPRPSGSDAADRAQRWVQDALSSRGWPSRRFEGRPDRRYPSIIACKEGLQPKVIAMFAHTDTVPDSPGANDNAAAIGVLLTAAEVLRREQLPRTLCLVFPDAEELGLRGSRAVAREIERAFGGPLDQVLALDLVGRGELTHHGLGPPFGESRLSALLGAAPASVPFVYRALSQGRPLMERSDHLWFTLLGVPSSHLMARAESGVDFAYHTPADTPDRLDPSTLQAAVHAVIAIARMPPLPQEHGSASIVLPFTAVVLPGWLTWATLASGPCVGVILALGGERPRTRDEIHAAARWLSLQAASLSAAFGAMALAAAQIPWDLARTEGVVAAGWGAWGAVQCLSRGGERAPLLLSAILSCTLAGAAVAAGLPLIGVPFALSALGCGLARVSPEQTRPLAALLTAWVPLYLVRADAIRELSHHHLLPATVPVWSVLLALLAAPISASLCRSVRPMLPLFLLLCAGGIALAWLTPEQHPPYVRALAP